MVVATQAQSSSTCNSFHMHGDADTSLRRDSRAGTAVIDPTAAQLTQPVPVHCLHIPAPALGHRGCYSDWTAKFEKSLFPRNLSHYQKYILNVIRFAGQLAV